jgi:hypothetical protein
MKKTLFISLAVALTIAACSDNNSKSYKSTGPYYGGETADDGYILPAMPDPKTNDKTLLGVDSNNNGIRDDVEIYIYNRFQGYTNSKVEREIAKQWARRAQQTLISPETAYEDGKDKLTDRVLSCQWYYYDTYLQNIRGFNNREAYRKQHDVFDAEFKDIVYNTKDRLKAYFRYNESMSGHVFEGYKHVKEACDFDPDPLIEGTL